MTLISFILGLSTLSLFAFLYRNLSRLKDVNKKLKSSLDTTHSLEDKLSILKKKNEDLLYSIQTKDEELIITNSENQRLGEIISEQEKTISSIQNNLHNTKAILSETLAKYARVLKDEHKKFRDNGENQIISSSLVSKEKQSNHEEPISVLCDELKKKNESIVASLDYQIKTNETLTEQINELKRQYDSLHTLYKGKIADCEKISNSNQLYLNQIEENKRKIYKLEKASENDKDRLDKLIQERRSASDKELKESQERAKTLEDELINAKSLIGSLKSQIDELRSNSIVQTNANDDEAELAITIEKLQHTNEELTKCRDELNLQIAISDKRAQMIDQLQCKISEAQKIREAVGIVPVSTPKKTENKTSKSKLLTDCVKSEKPQKIIIENDSISQKKKNIIEDDDIDLPPVQGNKGDVSRSILAVYDLESANPDIAISADSFFAQRTDIIEIVARKLEEADQADKDVFVCACCGNRVKISKRDYGWREVLFFSHCKHNIECDWKKEYCISLFPDNESEIQISGLSIDGVVSQYDEIKRYILQGLTGIKSQAIGVSSVCENKILHGRYNYLSWRRSCIFANYNGIDISFELQTRNILMNKLVDKDLFFRINHYHVIWIFGADDSNGYDYISKHVPKNILFANKRNVFIMDKEAINATIMNHELRLKCNYLDPDNKWHFRIDTTGNNGKLISLSELQFDYDTYKPYYFDANIEYFENNPESRNAFEDGAISTELFLSTLKERYDNKIAPKWTQRFQDAHSQNTPIPVNSEEKSSKITILPHAPGCFLEKKGNKFGVININGKTILPVEYDEIKSWHGMAFRVRKSELWGIVHKSGKEILPIKYLSISEPDSQKAIAAVDNGNEKYNVDLNGCRSKDEIIKLQNGWRKYRSGSRWGIINAKGQTIIECLYDEIGSFRGRLIEISNNQFFKLSTLCEYRVPITCKCIMMKKDHPLFEISGITMSSLQRTSEVIGSTRKDMYIANIIWKSNSISVNYLTDRLRITCYDADEKDSDFKFGGLYYGTVSKIERNKYYLSFPNGKKSYIKLSTLKNANGGYTPRIKTGSIIIVKKTGFEKDYDKTIWEVVKFDNR